MAREWTIDVCRTCGRLAVWPFCEHRPTGYVPWHVWEAWCESVHVREVGSPRPYSGQRPASSSSAETLRSMDSTQERSSASGSGS